MIRAINIIARLLGSILFEEAISITKLVLLWILVLGISEISFSQTASTHNGVSFSYVLTNGANEESKTSFHVGEAIVVLTKIENGSTNLIDYIVEDENYLYRFELTKTGWSLPIAYRSDKATLLSIREEEPGRGMVMIPDPILPGDTKTLDSLKLSNRYDNLAPGTYKLWL